MSYNRSSQESLGSILSRHSADYSEKARILFEKIMTQKPPPDLVESVPGLLLLIGELSLGDMKHTGTSSTSPWLTCDGVAQYINLFGVDNPSSLPRSIAKLPLELSFTFPLQNVPLHAMENTELVLVRYLSPGSGRFVTGELFSKKSFQLSPVDYWFVGFALLPLVEVGVVGSTGAHSWWTSGAVSTASNKGGGWLTNKFNHSSGQSTNWYDESKGSVYERLLLEYVEVVLGDKSSAGMPSVLIQGCSLMLSVWCDFVVNPLLFGSTSVSLNYRSILRLIQKIYLMMGGRPSSPLIETFKIRVEKLLFEITVSSSSYASRFLYKTNLAQCESLVGLWSAFVNTNRASPVLTQGSMNILQSSPVTDYLSDLFGALQIREKFDKLQSSTDTKAALSIFLTVVESSLSESPKDSSLRATLANYWQVCVTLTWRFRHTPKCLYNESVWMDQIVKKMNDERFSWEVTLVDEDTSQPDNALIVPKRIASTASTASIITQGQIKPPNHQLAWNSPVSSEEFEFLVKLLRRWFYSSDETKYILVRKLANYSYLLPFTVIVWIWFMIKGWLWLPGNLYAQCIFFGLFLVLIRKWTISLYVV